MSYADLAPIDNFLSHLVQIKQKYVICRFAPIDNFLSHLVQIKPEIEFFEYEKDKHLSIPLSSDKTDKKLIDKIYNEYFLSHLVQIKRLFIIISVITFISFLSHLVQIKLSALSSDISPRIKSFYPT